MTLFGEILLLKSYYDNDDQKTLLVVELDKSKADLMLSEERIN
jgi:hypothetical protein